MSASRPDASSPLWGKCADCAHCWHVAYLPMPITKFVKIAKGARCPKCGGRALVAKQDDGKLKEQGK